MPFLLNVHGVKKIFMNYKCFEWRRYFTMKEYMV